MICFVFLQDVHNSCLGAAVFFGVLLGPVLLQRVQGPTGEFQLAKLQQAECSMAAACFLLAMAITTGGTCMLSSQGSNSTSEHGTPKVVGVSCKLARLPWQALGGWPYTLYTGPTVAS